MSFSLGRYQVMSVQIEVKRETRGLFKLVYGEGPLKELCSYLHEGRVGDFIDNLTFYHPGF